MESLVYYKQAAQRKKNNELPTYEEFSQVYNENDGAGWLGRKVLALPNLLLTTPVRILCDTAQAFFSIFSEIIKAVRESETVKKNFEIICEDLKQGWGFIVVLVNDCSGLFQIERSDYQKMLYRGESIPVPAPAPPKAPPPPPPRAKNTVNKAVSSTVKDKLKRTNSQPELTTDILKKWKPIDMNELMAARQRIMQEKRSEKERKPEVATPEKKQDEKLVQSTLQNMRKYLEHSPDLRSSKSKARLNSSKSTDSTENKPVVQRRLFPAGE